MNGPRECLSGLYQSLCDGRFIKCGKTNFVFGQPWRFFHSSMGIAHGICVRVVLLANVIFVPALLGIMISSSKSTCNVYEISCHDDVEHRLDKTSYARKHYRGLCLFSGRFLFRSA